MTFSDIKKQTRTNGPAGFLSSDLKCGSILLVRVGIVQATFDEHNPTATQIEKPYRQVSKLMHIIPVLDILNGVVVRGVAGRRKEYRPIHSSLTDSVDPSVILRLLNQQFGLSECYIADLDAIQGRSLNRCTLAELARSTDSLIVDRGVRAAADVEELRELGIDRAVIAMETLPGLEVAAELVRKFGADSLTASIDLQNGQPLISNREWRNATPLQIVNDMIKAGFHQFIVLDLASVGMDGGISTLSLCRELKSQLPSAHVITGGGIRGPADLLAAQESGVDAVLVASALHDGRLSVEDTRPFIR